MQHAHARAASDQSAARGRTDPETSDYGTSSWRGPGLLSTRLNTRRDRRPLVADERTRRLRRASATLGAEGLVREAALRHRRREPAYQLPARLASSLCASVATTTTDALRPLDAYRIYPRMNDNVIHAVPTVEPDPFSPSRFIEPM